MSLPIWLSGWLIIMVASVGFAWHESSFVPAMDRPQPPQYLLVLDVTGAECGPWHGFQAVSREIKVPQYATCPQAKTFGSLEEVLDYLNTFVSEPERVHGLYAVNPARIPLTARVITRETPHPGVVITEALWRLADDQ